MSGTPLHFKPAGPRWQQWDEGKPYPGRPFHALAARQRLLVRYGSVLPGGGCGNDIGEPVLQ